MTPAHALINPIAQCIGIIDALMVFGVVDADRGEDVLFIVHCTPRLHLGHLILDAVEQRIEVESFGILIHTALRWYAGDVERDAGSVLNFVGRYSPEVRAAVQAGTPPTIRWMEYDWSLNAQDRVE